MNLLNISGSPHVHSDESTKKIMWRVNLALVPMLLTGIAFFGLNALLISLVSVACCCLFQWLIVAGLQRACQPRDDVAGDHRGTGGHRHRQDEFWRTGQEPLQSRTGGTCVHAYFLPCANDHLAHSGQVVPDEPRHRERRHTAGCNQRGFEERTEHERNHGK